MSDLVQLNPSVHRVPPRLAAGCVQLTGLDKFPLTELVYVCFDKNVEVDFTLFFKDGMIMVCVYRLPAGREELQRLADMYGRKRKKFVRVPRVGKWNAQMLMLPKTPARWEHESFPTDPGCFVHIYRGPKHAMLIRYMRNRGPMLSYKPFELFNRNLRIDETSWRLEFPPLKPRADLKPAAAESKLPKDVVKEVRSAIRRAKTLLKVDTSSRPDKQVAAIMACIDETRARKPRPSKDDIESLAVDLGCLWGQALCDELGWVWREVDYGKGRKPISVVSPDRAFAVAPMTFILKLLTQPARTADNTSLLLYNMIKDGNLPPSAPKQYLPLS